MYKEKDIIGNALYQKKVVIALIQDHKFAEQVCDIMEPDFFDQKYLRNIVSVLFKYKKKYNSFPSIDVIKDIILKTEANEIIKEKIFSFIKDMPDNLMNGDIGYIEETSIDFCRKQTLMAAMFEAANDLENNNFDSVWKKINTAVNKGAVRDLGHEYIDGLEDRIKKSERKIIPTPWNLLNEAWTGGYERGSLVTFMAPTGGGKTAFLCNCSGFTVQEGFNCVYITLEEDYYKIGLRHDAYYSKIPIKQISNNAEKVQEELKKSLKNCGRFFIKKYSNKQATVQTIRAYIQRIKITKNFNPDVIVLDYANLLKTGKDKDGNSDLESAYNDLRAIAEENNAVLITAEQTNRTAIDQEKVGLQNVAGRFDRLTVCDAVLTVARTLEDKNSDSGRLAVAKSRFGGDGKVFSFVMKPEIVRATLVNSDDTLLDVARQDNEFEKNKIIKRLNKL